VSEPTVETDTDTQNAQSEEPKASETFFLQATTSTGNPIGDIDQLAFFDYSEYKEFIGTTDKLPGDFVYYEDIAHLGTFKSIVFIQVHEFEGYEEYDQYYGDIMYGLIDSTNTRFSLYVDKEAFNYSTPVSSKKIDAEKVNATDMRKISVNEHGIYTHEGIEYLYKYGELLTIRWKSGEQYFRLSSFFDLIDFENISESNLSAAFNLETAYEFISSIAPIDPIE
jgi:hypothetical protein